MKKVSLILITAFFLLPWLVKKPQHLKGVRTLDNYSIHRDAGAGDKSFPPLILATSLKDSVSQNAIVTLGLDNVPGVKFKYRNGSFASYFSYRANKQDLLRAMALLPVQIGSHVADTTYRQIAFSDLHKIRNDAHGVEIENAASFWQTSEDNFEAFECLKPPFRHVILVSKSSDQVFHRVCEAV
jgi:hypothetical protein